MRPNRGAASAILLMLAVANGCGKSGPQVAPVRGRITLDGRPLANADVTFQPDDSRRASIGRTDADGRYELAYKRGQSGAIVGRHTVRIAVSSELVRNPPPIPARYNTQSELHPEVEPGDNEFNFDVTTEENAAKK
jgi:hypothetical protein